MSTKRASRSLSFWKVIESIGESSDQHGRARERGRGGRSRPGRHFARLRLRRSRGGRFLLPVLAGVALDAAGGVEEALLAGEERVAAGADLQPQLLALGGAGRPGRPAGAVDVDGDVVR